MDMEKVWSEIPGSAYYPDSRIVIPIYPHYTIEFDADKKVYLRKYNDATTRVSQKMLADASNVNEAELALFLVEFTEEIVDKILTRIFDRIDPHRETFQWDNPE